MTEVDAAPPAPPLAEAPSRWQALVLRALASDWGLRVLAVVLAVLVWSVVRQEIETQQWIYVDVTAKPRSPERFEALPLGRERIQIQLRGPQGEIDDAREMLGERPAIDVLLDDLPAGEDRADVGVQWPREAERFVFRFPRRLVAHVPELRIRVYRRLDQRARIEAPRFLNAPEGWEARDVRVEPTEVGVLGPAGVLGEAVAPDPVDVGPAFAEGRAAKGPLAFDLFFNAWRAEDPVRGGVALPRASVAVRFVAVARRKIANAFLIVYAAAQGDDADDYDWAVDASVPDLAVDQRRFLGEFRGGTQDLETLEQRRGEWSYALQIPAEEMAAFRRSEERTVTLRAPLVWLPSTEALRRLPVEMIPPATHAAVQVTVTKKE